MEITVRSFEPNRDMDEIISWFQSIEWPHAPVENLMPQIGLLACEGDTRLACGFLYTTGTSKAEMSWLNTNPQVEGSKQLLGLKTVIETLQEKAMTLPRPIRLIEIVSTDEGLKMLLKQLKFRFNKKPIYRASYMPPKVKNLKHEDG